MGRERVSHDLVLIDDKDRFELTAALFTAAYDTSLETVQKTVALYTRPYTTLLAPYHVTFIKGTVKRVTPGKLILEQATVLYDELVLCSGYTYAPSPLIPIETQLPIDVRADPTALHDCHDLLILGQGLLRFSSSSSPPSPRPVS